MSLDDLEAMVRYVAGGGRVYCDEFSDAREVVLAARGAGHPARLRQVAGLVPGEPTGWIVEPVEPWVRRVRRVRLPEPVAVLLGVGLAWLVIVLAWAVMGR